MPLGRFLIPTLRILTTWRGKDNMSLLYRKRALAYKRTADSSYLVWLFLWARVGSACSSFLLRTVLSAVAGLDNALFSSIPSCLSLRPLADTRVHTILLVLVVFLLHYTRRMRFSFSSGKGRHRRFAAVCLRQRLHSAGLVMQTRWHFYDMSRYTTYSAAVNPTISIAHLACRVCLWDAGCFFPVRRALLRLRFYVGDGLSRLLGGVRVWCCAHAPF
jgi:hypothetical protein